jgi:hypothetical protein
MVEFDKKPVLLLHMLPELPAYRSDGILTDLNDNPTLPTVDMDMGAMPDSGIHGFATTKIETTGDSLFDEEIQRSVDGRQIDSMDAVMHRLRHLFRGHMAPAVGNRFNDHLALWGDAVPPLAQFCYQGVAV